MKGFVSRFLLGFFTGVGIITFLVVLFLGFVYFYFFGAEKTLPKQMIVNFEFHGPIIENSSDNPFEYLGLGHILSLRTIIESLDKASKDKRVKGIIFRTIDPDLSLIQAEEIREAIHRIRKEGKFAYFYTDSFGDGTWGTVPYFLASAFDEIWIQPSGSIGLIGIAGEIPFYKNVMDNVGVGAQYGQRYEYKSAPNSYLHESIPPTQLEMEKSLMAENYKFIVETIAKEREIEAEKIKEIVDQAPISAQKAIETNLVTKLGFWNDFKEAVNEKNENVDWVKFPEYVRSLKPHESENQKIALIYIEGGIVRGRSAPFDLLPGESVGGETVAKAIRQAMNDDEVVAILLRIDCPGGSYPASDMVWNEVRRAREKKKPVIASIGGVAASGGYFMAMLADRIIADASSLTGSIGVYSGKLYFDNLWKKVGVNWDVIKEGKNADMWSQNKPFSDSAMKIMDEELDIIYKDFTTKVSNARNIPLDQLDKIARGRVWTGAQGLQNGLVDQIGGYYDAVRAAKRAAGIPIDKDIKIEIFPRPKPLIERLSDYLENIEDFTQTSMGLQKIIQGSLQYLSPFFFDAEWFGKKSTPALYYHVPRRIEH